MAFASGGFGMDLGDAAHASPPLHSTAHEDSDSQAGLSPPGINAAYYQRHDLFSSAGQSLPIRPSLADFLDPPARYCRPPRLLFILRAASDSRDCAVCVDRILATEQSFGAPTPKVIELHEAQLRDNTEAVVSSVQDVLRHSHEPFLIVRGPIKHLSLVHHLIHTAEEVFYSPFVANIFPPRDITAGYEGGPPQYLIRHASMATTGVTDSLGPQPHRIMRDGKRGEECIDSMTVEGEGRSAYVEEMEEGGGSDEYRLHSQMRSRTFSDEPIEKRPKTLTTIKERRLMPILKTEDPIAVQKKGQKDTVKRVRFGA
uniref:Uncharacterized protein n=1 Tax=Palpitomonas bilix TaxID=652834 RepID=A0A7S3LUK0_9EUKA|mmetsp:Transcript_47628/g.123454  ORF Transcript_47628/g.123454 Transcript_47628/m.123454 type:complete len:314 (+) Transcript_47628:251-1192(+)